MHYINMRSGSKVVSRQHVIVLLTLIFSTVDRVILTPAKNEKKYRKKLEMYVISLMC